MIDGRDTIGQSARLSMESKRFIPLALGN